MMAPKVGVERPDVLVCGTGSIGMRHLHVLRDRLGLKPYALPVRPERRPQLMALGFEAFDDRRAPGHAAPLAVLVCTDTSRHVSDALHWLPYGDVLVEKPLAASTRGLAELEAATKSFGHRLFVAYCLRFDPVLRELRCRLPALGALLSVRIECQSFLPDWRPNRDYRLSYSARPGEGGVLQDLAHELDYAVWLFGRPTHVFCCTSNTGTLAIEAEETADLLWQVKDSAVVSLRLDYLARTPRRRLSIIAEQGELEADLIGGTLTGHSNGTPVHYRALPERDRLLAEQAAAFLSVDADDRGLATLREGAFIVALTEAARRSATSGRLEAIKDWRD